MPNRIPSRRASTRKPSRLLVVAALVAACSTTAPSPSPAPTAVPVAPSPTTVPATPVATQRPLQEVYADIRTKVEAIRGLQPTADVEPVVIDATQLAKNLEQEFDATHTDQALQDAEDELITLGLLAPGTSLRAITLAFQGGQVAGYYSPESNELFVVSRTTAVGPADESTYAHEFTHQLQDQHVDLDKLGIDVSDQSDRSLARLALVEGDAVSVQTTWMTENLTSQELGQVLAAGLDPDALKAFNDAPAYLRETALFPYQQGLAFVMRLVGSGGYAAVDAVFADPPDSTEQILHPDKYTTREAPIAVKIPSGLAKALGTGWSEVGQDTLGEFLLRVWLKQGGVTNLAATAAAEGWGGDRLVLLRGPSGAVSVAFISAWDTAADAAEFQAAAATAARALDPGATVFSDDLRRVYVVMGDEVADVAAAVAK
ncbi:MAG TPA: hypothetical protein VFI15_07315 [Candidatus Limnocylindrales bacterium]|nr:hypothetical protein [Candidatus Limnocylindrales bacterium]